MKKSQKTFNRRNFIKKSSGLAAVPFLAPVVHTGSFSSALAAKKKVALVGTGSRGSNTWGKSLLEAYKNQIEFVGLCDINRSRLAWAKKHIGTNAPTYHSSDFDKMIAETKPDTVIVTTTDCFHAKYVKRALELGCDVLSEKPLITEAKQGQEILEAEQQSGKRITTTFNARFGNSTEEIKRILMSGELGRIVSAEFQEYLDIDHGASYFRRWHGKMRFSGSLLVHKASHHFDQMNWWLDAEPVEVNAFGKVAFYGKNNDFRGKNCRSCAFTSDCRFYWDINKDPGMGLYLTGEKEDGYLRDGCVWDNDIDTYDSMTVEVKYQNDVLLCYSLNAFMPYEGQRIAFNGEKGRLDVREYFKQPWEVGHDSELRITKISGETRAWTVKSGEGTHGGADKKLKDLIFVPDQPDPLSQSAGSRAGIISSLIGIAARQSIETNQRVLIKDLIDFPPDWKW